MEEEKVILEPPPRLLLGVTFLFWGSMVDQPLMGLMGALLVEARHWMSLRWKFGETGFARAWQLSLLILAITVVVKFGTEIDRVTSAIEVLTVLPLIFLPLSLAQQYSSDRGVPVTTFSFVARRKMTKDRKAGLEVKVLPCQIGYPYLGMLLASAGLDFGNFKTYSLGVAALLGVSLLFLQRGQHRPWAWGIAFAMSLMCSVALAAGMFYLYGKWAQPFQDGEGAQDSQVQTALGQVTKLQLSSDIRWRHIQVEGSAPPRIRMASYNLFARDRWKARMSFTDNAPVLEEYDLGGGWVNLYANDADSHRDFVYQEDDLSSSGSGRSILLGKVRDHSLLPIPPKSFRFQKVAAEGVEANLMGTTRMGNPDQGAIALEVITGEGRVAEEDPYIHDLVIPGVEFDGVTRFWEQQGVEVDPWQKGRVALPEMVEGRVDEEPQIQSWMQLQMLFRNNFRYTTNLAPKRNRPAVTHFLHEMKEGHCEYFASATALLLRRANIPTRYVVGFVMRERGDEKGEWILRGKHAHAWCQAYLGGVWEQKEARPGSGKMVWRCRGGRWVDVDLTPPDWEARQEVDEGWRRDLADWWQLFREDVLIWFGRPLVSKIIEILIWTLAMSLGVWIFWRLWQTRSRNQKNLPNSWAARCANEHSLEGLEKWLSKKIGPRPIGIPMASWINEQYPEGASALLVKYQRMKFDSTDGSETLKKEIIDFKKYVMQKNTTLS